MNTNRTIEKLARKEQDKLAKARLEVRDSTLAKISMKKEAFAKFQLKLIQIENLGYEDSLRVSIGEWATTIHLKNTEITSVKRRFLPFSRKPAGFDDKPQGWRWRIRVVFNDDGEIEWETEEIRPHRGGALQKFRVDDPDGWLKYVKERIGQEIGRQRGGFYD